MARLKLKHLESMLNSIDDFKSPKLILEQYATPPHIASCMLYNIQTNYEDIEGKFVGDLGAGCGMLSIGSSVLGAYMTIGFEIDSSAVEMFRSNVSETEVPGIDCVQCNVLHLSRSNWSQKFDTIIMNPPFGTKNNAGIDMLFVEQGIHMASSSVYSLHKKSTRNYIKKKTREWNVKGDVIAELVYNLEQTYKFHKKNSLDIEVDVWRFDVSEKDL